MAHLGSTCPRDVAPRDMATTVRESPRPVGIWLSSRVARRSGPDGCQECASTNQVTEAVVDRLPLTTTIFGGWGSVASRVSAADDRLRLANRLLGRECYGLGPQAGSRNRPDCGNRHPADRHGCDDGSMPLSAPRHRPASGVASLPPASGLMRRGLPPSGGRRSRVPRPRPDGRGGAGRR